MTRTAPSNKLHAPSRSSHRAEPAVRCCQWRKLSAASFLLLALACVDPAGYNPGDPAQRDFYLASLSHCLLRDALCPSTAILAPGSVSNNKLWLEADELSLADGAAVASWPDKSGAGNDASQGTMAQQPAYVASAFVGRPVVRFTNGSPGTNLTLGGNFLYSTGDGMTIVAVVRSNVEDVTTNNIFDFGKNGQAGYGLSFAANSDGVSNNLVFYTANDAAAGGGFASAATTVATSQPVVIIAQIKFAPAGGEQNVYLNGNLAKSVGSLSMTQMVEDYICRSATRGVQNLIASALPSDPGICAGGADYGPVTIGGQSKTNVQANRFFDGDIAMVAWFDRALTASERAGIECYAATKYGMVVPHTCW